MELIIYDRQTILTFSFLISAITTVLFAVSILLRLTERAHSHHATDRAVITRSTLLLFSVILMLTSARGPFPDIVPSEVIAAAALVLRGLGFGLAATLVVYEIKRIRLVRNERKRTLLAPDDQPVL